MRLIAFALMISISLTSCATYDGANISGRWKDVTRADIAAAVEAVRTETQLNRQRNTLHEVDVISPNEIELLWNFGEEDIVKRIHGKWHWVITYVVVGRQKI